MARTDRPLTDDHREMLQFAFDEGYFDQPRGFTQDGLAEEFGISSRAVSDRLRRGPRNLIASTLVDAAPVDDGH